MRYKHEVKHHQSLEILNWRREWKKKKKDKIHGISNVCTVFAIGEQIESAFSCQKKEKRKRNSTTM